jgi:hydrogenase maturation protease
MPRVLIIAYGNPLRCDDGLAWRAAQELAKQNLGEAVEIITTHQLTPELAASVSQASTVVFIDAAHDGAAGELTFAKVLPQPQSSVFTHEFSPGAILNLSRELYGKRPEASMVSICGESFDHGETLSAKVIAALPGLIDRVKELIQQAG